MQLHIQQRGQGQPLILLHGWGFNGTIWEETAKKLAMNWTVYQVDLPGHGQSPMCEYTLPVLSQCLTENLPKNAIWIGWSLGGLMATAAALHFPESVRGLVLVGSSPRFVVGEDWQHAMQQNVLQLFAQQLQQDIAGTLKRFLALQVKDSPEARLQLRQLQHFLQNAGYPHPDALNAGLNLLITSDLRNNLSQIKCPALLCLGAKDALVPVGMGDDCQRYWKGLRKVCIKQAAHIPFISHPELFLQILQSFFHEHGLSSISG
jgi:pimeloyl-[acyl-carrier protein] methyl ester esterase